MTAIAAPRSREPDRLASHVAAHATVYYLSLALIAIAAGWAGRLNWGFWTDEGGSFWMSSGGWSSAIAKTQHFPGQSLFYSGLLSFFHHPGPHQELWLRLPSILGVLAAGYFLFRLTTAIAGQGTGYLAVVPFFCTIAVIQGATYARPYGLALAAATGCGWKFYQFLRTGSRRAFVEYLLFSLFVIYFQYFFGTLLAVQFVFALFRRLRGHRVPWVMFVVAPAVWILSLWPLRESLSVLLQFGRGSYAAPVPPTIAQFFLLCFPLAPLLGGALGCVAVACAFPRSWKPRFDWPEVSLALLITWLLALPLLFFALARLTPYDLFATRYLLFITPAFFVLLACLISWIPATHHRILVLLAIMGGTVLHPANLLQVYAGQQQGDWRAAIETVHQFSGSGRPPVFVRSGLAESNRMDWRGGALAGSIVLAPLAAYPVENPVLPVPYQFTPEVQQFINDKLSGDLRNATRVLVVAESDAEILPWIEDRMKALGYTTRLNDQSGYTVAAFDRIP